MIFKHNVRHYVNNYDALLSGICRLYKKPIHSYETNNSDIFDNKLMQYYMETKVFNISDSIHKLLIKTNNKIYNRQLPFNNFFININFPPKFFFENNNILKRKAFAQVYGLWIMFKPHYDTPVVHFYKPEIDNDNHHIIISFELFNSKGNILFDFLRVYICNFLDFLNTNEAETIIIERTREQHIKRKKRGKKYLPTQVNIKLHGELKKYINIIESNNKINYNHKFWVRGHFRTLKDNEKYGKNVGKKIWILPFIKGKGILIKKEYNVT